MPPLHYANTPPAAGDITLSRDFLRAINEGGDEQVVSVIGTEDAAQLTQDFERDGRGFVNLSQVRRELMRASEDITNPDLRTAYQRGVAGLLDRSLGR